MQTISFQDFEKLDIRVGTIIKAEAFPEAKKPAYKLEIDFGKEIGIKRSSAQITKHYTKEQLKGKKCILFVNLAPRMMRSIQSDGMILAAVSEDESKVILLQPEKDIEIGSKIR